MSLKCPNCGSVDIDTNEAMGQMACVSCGRVIEENAIVSQVQFAEHRTAPWLWGSLLVRR